MYKDLKDKVVLITGAAGHLAGGVVRYFDTAGAKLALFDRTLEHFDRAFGDALGPNWGCYAVDITDPTAVTDSIGEVVAQFGRIDVLINIAGGYAGGKNALETDIATWDKMMALNAKSVFLMSRAVIQVMLERGEGGRIVNIGAKPGLQGTKNHAVYAASKSAVLRLTESMAAEFRSAGINVNAVVPSMLDTPPNREAMPKADFSQWVTPDSLAGVIGFLSADVSKDISGALIPVYGG